MSTNQVQKGDNLTISNASGAAYTSGQSVLVGTRLAICGDAIANGATGTAVFRGVFLLTKATGASTGGAQGAIAYWDDTAKKVTAVSTSNTNIGYFAAVCVDGDATANVKLTG